MYFILSKSGGMYAKQYFKEEYTPWKLIQKYPNAEKLVQVTLVLMSTVQTVSSLKHSTEIQLIQPMNVKVQTILKQTSGGKCKEKKEATMSKQGYQTVAHYIETLLHSRTRTDSAFVKKWVIKKCVLISFIHHWQVTHMEKRIYINKLCNLHNINSSCPSTLFDQPLAILVQLKALWKHKVEAIKLRISPSHQIWNLSSYAPIMPVKFGTKKKKKSTKREQFTL